MTSQNTSKEVQSNQNNTLKNYYFNDKKKTHVNVHRGIESYRTASVKYGWKNEGLIWKKDAK